MEGGGWGSHQKKTKEWCTEIHSKVEKDAMGTRATNSWHRSLLLGPWVKAGSGGCSPDKHLPHLAQCSSLTHSGRLLAWAMIQPHICQQSRYSLPSSCGKARFCVQFHVVHCISLWPGDGGQSWPQVPQLPQPSNGGGDSGFEKGPSNDVSEERDIKCGWP